MSVAAGHPSTLVGSSGRHGLPSGHLGRARPHAEPAAPPTDAARLLRGLRPDGVALSLEEHLRVHGPLPSRGRHLGDEVAAAASASGLLGRGGGRYPFARKLASVREAAGARRRPYVVVNAAESEPASRKDWVLVTRTPHLVLDGAALAAAAVGAREAVVWLHRGDLEARRVLERAVAERAAARLPDPAWRLEDGPARYVAGESSAIVRHLSGGPAQPTMSPPRVARRGVDGKPTLLSNAETFAHLALVLRHGPRWFRVLGTQEDPGTMLLTVAGAVVVAGVVEAPVGSPVRSLVTAAGGLTTARPSALLVGGYAGAWLEPSTAWDLPFSAAGLRTAGAEPGVGLVAVLPERSCPVGETARLAAWLAGEGAQQCGPCLNGLPAIARAAGLLALGGAAAGAAPAMLERWTGMVDGRGACHHPDGVARLVRSLLDAFPAEVARHAEAAGCSFGTDPFLPLPAPGGAAWR